MKNPSVGVTTAQAARGKTPPSRGLIHGLLAATLLSLIPEPGAGQWRNRYPHVAGYGHHVYLEGYELPVLTNGPIDPAPSPDGRRPAFSARGWIWIMDLESRTARRLTHGCGRRLGHRSRSLPDSRLGSAR